MIKFKRFAVVLMMTLVNFMLQFILLPKIPYLLAVPNLMLAETVSVGFLYGKAIGLATGVVCGLLTDILGIGNPGFYTLAYAWIGFGNGFLSERMESEVLYVLFVLILLNEILLHIYVLLFSFLIGKHFSLGSYLPAVFLPELFLTIVSFVPVYGILIFISKRWNLRVNKGEVKIV